jgi:hypothetical protein
VKKGRPSSVAAQAALDAIERERTELVFHASRDERRVYEEAMKVIPQSAALYRAAVRDLNSTLRDPTERAEARALIAELLGRQVRIRQDGAAVFARLEIDEAVLLASAAKSFEINDFQVGSGGATSFIAITPLRFRQLLRALWQGREQDSDGPIQISRAPSRSLRRSVFL